MRASTVVRLGSVIVVLAIGVLIWQTFRSGWSARDRPTALESAVARIARHLATPASLRSAHDPAPVTPEVLAGARAHWADHCASCHGNDGKGATEIGRHLYPPAPDMTAPETQRLSDGELFAVIENGIRLTGMPAWGDGSEQSVRDSWSLVHFIRHLPALSADEVRAMERLNQKSPAEWHALQEEEEFLRCGRPPASAEAHDPSGHEH